MKAGWKIAIKLAMIGFVLAITPFYETVLDTISKTDVKALAYQPNKINTNISLKDNLNVLSYHKNENLSEDPVNVETTQENEVVVPKPKEPNKTNKKQKTVYIYDTHQEEEYADGKGVMDAAAVLGDKLEEKGVKVVLETHDFEKYLSQRGMDYNQSYLASNKFLQEALVNYGGFDLCIDLHRDSIPRNVSILKANNKTYAKAMMVVGNLATYYKSSKAISSTLTDIMNKKVNGIMKSVMEREAYYNQQVAEKIVLIEVGAEVNTFEEVKHTTDVLAEGIFDLLNGG